LLFAAVCSGADEGPDRLLSAFFYLLPVGPQGHDGSVVIRLGGRLEDLLKLYASCTDAGVTGNPWAMPYENRKTLRVCRGRQPSMDKAWPSFRHYG